MKDNEELKASQLPPAKEVVHIKAVPHAVEARTWRVAGGKQIGLVYQLQ
jgi:hypothetical protein